MAALTRLGGIGSTADVLALTSRKRLRRAVGARRVLHVSRGRYALPVADEARDVAARVGGHLRLLSAAAHWGWETKWPARFPQVVAARKPERPVDGELVCDTLPRADLDGWATSHLRTVLDCAAELPFDEALAVADSALRHGDLTRDDLARAVARQAAEGAAARRAARRARQEAARGDPVRADGPAAGPRHHLHGRHPRPGGGHGHGRPHRGDAGGQDRRRSRRRRRSTRRRPTATSPTSSATSTCSTAPSRAGATAILRLAAAGTIVEARGRTDLAPGTPAAFAVRPEKVKITRQAPPTRRQRAARRRSGTSAISATGPSSTSSSPAATSSGRPRSTPCAAPPSR